MTSRDFAYWLQGFFEISGESLEAIDKEKVQMIKQHLNMVFVHEIDPSHGGPEEQKKLNALHKPTPPKPASGGFPPVNSDPNGPIYRC